ncbi:hypothetical protein R1flu_013022 [Riccia fluitans]|uniref:Uncharacterized protein n=1 Tax=Riccia fluitans TaxID=41844 RepID=A0ABD1ZC98_9MARC
MPEFNQMVVFSSIDRKCCDRTQLICPVSSTIVGSWRSADTTETNESKESGVSTAVIIEDLAPKGFMASLSSTSADGVETERKSGKEKAYRVLKGKS